MPTDGKPKNGIVRQLFSYGGVSAMQTFVEFGVFAVLQLAGLPFRLANAVAVFCSGSFNYVMNRNVTFKYGIFTGTCASTVPMKFSAQPM